MKKSAVKNMLLGNWTFMRWLRLFLGVTIGIQAVVSHDVLSGGIAAFLLLQTAFNRGCCGMNGCETLPRTGYQEREIEFEEVKNK